MARSTTPIEDGGAQMATRGRTRAGQGTLEYVLIFALIAIVLLVVAFLLRNQLRNASKEVVNKVQSWGKELPKEKADKKAGDKDKKDKSLKVQRPPEEGEAAPKDSKFSFELTPARRVIYAGVIVAIVLGLILYFRQAKRS